MKSIKGYRFLKGLGLATLFLSFIALTGLAFMLLWNWLMPVVFGLGAITFLQAIGLMFLLKMVSKVLGGRRHSRHHMRRWRHSHHRCTWERSQELS